MSAAPAPCTHPGAYVVAHLGSHEPLLWQPVPAPTGTELWDIHRPAGTCLDPRELGLIQTKNGIWRRRQDCPRA